MSVENGGFQAFYWGVIRIVHKGCSFVALAQRLNVLVHPRIIEVPESVESAIPFYSVLDEYFVPQELKTDLAKKPLPELDIYKVSADFDNRRTLLLGGSSDEILRQTVRHPKFAGRGLNLYAKPDYEYIPVQTVNRAELDAIEGIFRKLAEELEGSAVLDTVGKVASFQELLFWRRSIRPEPTAVPGLTREEIRILESAIAYGYYQTPRAIHLDKLAEKLSMTKSTLDRRLREIEEKIVNNTLFVQLTRRL